MSATMQALRFDRYGAPAEVLRLREVDVPVPAERQVLVRVRSASANPVEWHLVRGEPFLLRLLVGVRRPKDTLIGGDVAGVVEAVGPGVEDLATGDAVFGTAEGAWAELACAKAARLALKPNRLSFEQAASIPVAGCTALQALRDHARLQAGQRVLVVGAAGGVGSFAVQIAKALGATVTGVCSGTNVDFVRSLGADAVIDYALQDFTALPERYDVVLQIAGNRSVADLRRVLTARGTLVMVGSGVGRDGSSGALGPLTRMLVSRVASRKSGKRVATFIARIQRADLEALAALAEDGLLTPAVERTYPLAHAASALAEIEGGHARGKIVLAVEPLPPS